METLPVKHVEGDDFIFDMDAEMNDLRARHHLHGGYGATNWRGVAVPDEDGEDEVGEVGGGEDS